MRQEGKTEYSTLATTIASTIVASIHSPVEADAHAANTRISNRAICELVTTLLESRARLMIRKAVRADARRRGSAFIA